MSQSHRPVCASCLGQITSSSSYSAVSSLSSPSSSTFTSSFPRTSSTATSPSQRSRSRPIRRENGGADGSAAKRRRRAGSRSLIINPISLILLVTFGLLCGTVSASASSQQKRDSSDDPGLATAGGSGSGTTLPRAFDASIGTNFTTSSCESFFSRMIADPNLEACHPVSLMLRNSDSWFQATKLIATITQALDASCSVPFDTCTSVMNSYANQLLSDDACLQDYNNQNPLVVDADAGFLAYEAIYHATCLKDNTTDDNYCYANAITNKSSPANAFVYLIPLGAAMPVGAVPVCNYCLKNTMADFSTCAANSSQPCSTAYPSAAQQLDMYCGPTFAITDVKMTSLAAPSFLAATSRSLGVACMLAVVLCVSLL